MNDINLGKKINQFRLQKKMTIKELAEKTGMTQSMLSQIERDLTNPSINTLKKISKSLSIPLFRLFQETENTNFVVHADARKTLGFPGSRDITYELLTADTSGSIEFCLMKIPPLYNPEDYFICHEGEEVAYVMVGPIDIMIEENRFTLYSGDSLKIPPLSNHMWINRTENEVSVIFAITPPTF